MADAVQTTPVTSSAEGGTDTANGSGISNKSTPSQIQQLPRVTPSLRLNPVPIASAALRPGLAARPPDAVDGAHKDGRVRNPIPSKLKGKTDGRQGNFSVMHMDLNVRTEMAERGAAAKRTSESTKMIAELAQKDGYVPLRRSKHVYLPDHLAAPSPPNPVVPFTSLPPPHPQDPTAEAIQTKEEQARLLTLLRSLHPLLVVDQICKALAFFGGIPGAPPPSNGIFPESARANGDGSLFVGWIAEIFPALISGTGDPPPTPPAQAVQPAQAASQPSNAGEQRRPRGRPRGSKGTRPRSDKGTKKGPVGGLGNLRNAANGTVGNCDANENDATETSWVDVDETALESDTESEHQESDASSPVELPVVQFTLQTTAGHASAALRPAPSATPTATPAVAPTANSASGRRRGRPKGSRNRPKTSVEAASHSARLTNGGAGGAGGIVPNPKTPQPSKKSGPGRPKGSKNRPKLQKSGPPGPSAKLTPGTTLARPEGTQPRTMAEAMVVTNTTVAQQTQAQSTVPAVSSLSLPQTPSSPGISRPAAGAGAARSQVGTNNAPKRKRGGQKESSASQIPPGAMAPPQGGSQAADRSRTALPPVTGKTVEPVEPTPKRQRTSRGSAREQRQQASVVPVTSVPESGTSISTSGVGTSWTYQHSTVESSGSTVGSSSLTLEPGTRQINRPSTSSNGTPRRQQQHQSGVLHSPASQQRNAQSLGLNTTRQAGVTQMSTSFGSSQGGQSPQTYYSQQSVPSNGTSQYSQSSQSTPQNRGQQRLPQVRPGELGPAPVQNVSRDAHHFSASTAGLASGDGTYRGVTPMGHQTSYTTRGNPSTSVSQPNGSFHTGTSHSVSHQSPSYTTRQTTQSSGSNLSSFSGYGESTFLDIPSLDANTTPVTLGMGSSSYGLGQASMQQSAASAAAAAAFGSASGLSHSGFDGSIVDTSMGDRMYQNLASR
jgi:hypothetical protein